MGQLDRSFRIVASNAIERGQQRGVHIFCLHLRKLQEPLRRSFWESRQQRQIPGFVRRVFREDLKVVGGPELQPLVHHPGLFLVVAVLHEYMGARGNRDENDRQHHPPAPCPENLGHLGFVGVFGGAVVARRPLPAPRPVEHGDHPNEKIDRVKVFLFPEVERIHQRLPAFDRQQRFRELRLREGDQKEQCHQHKHDIGEGSLDKVRHHDGNLATHEGERD